MLLMQGCRKCLRWLLCMYIVSLFLTVCLPLVDRQSVLVSANLPLLSFALMVKTVKWLD